MWNYRGQRKAIGIEWREWFLLSEEGLMTTYTSDLLWMMRCCPRVTFACIFFPKGRRKKSSPNYFLHKSTEWPNGQERAGGRSRNSSFFFDISGMNHRKLFRHRLSYQWSGCSVCHAASGNISISCGKIFSTGKICAHFQRVSRLFSLWRMLLFRVDLSIC